MEAFNLLRRQARDKRDKVIAAARDDYVATLVRIAELEQDLLGRDPVAYKSIASCIERVIPTDRTFTTVDIMAGLEAIDPGRVWRKRSVDSHIYRLRERKLVRRVRKASNHEPATYVRVGVKVEPLPFEGMTLAEAIADVMDGQRMTATEVTVKLAERGYQTAMTRRALKDAVGVILRCSGPAKVSRSF